MGGALAQGPSAFKEERRAMETVVRHVLVVDDDADSRAVLTTLLRMMGYSAMSAASGDEALHIVYSKMECDAVVANVIMPGLSGIEFARLTRKVRPGIPIVFVAGHPDEIDVATKAGVIPLLRPFTRERLEAVLADASRSQKTGSKGAQS